MNVLFLLYLFLLVERGSLQFPSGTVGDEEDRHVRPVLHEDRRSRHGEPLFAKALFDRLPLTVAPVHAAIALGASQTALSLDDDDVVFERFLRGFQDIPFILGDDEGRAAHHQQDGPSFRSSYLREEHVDDGLADPVSLQRVAACQNINGDRRMLRDCPLAAPSQGNNRRWLLLHWPVLRLSASKSYFLIFLSS